MKVRKELLRVFLLTFCLAPTCTSYNDFNNSLIRPVSSVASENKNSKDRKEEDRTAISVARKDNRKTLDPSIDDMLGSEHDSETEKDNDDKDNLTPSVVIPETGSGPAVTTLPDGMNDPNNLFLPFGTNPLFGIDPGFDFDIIGTPGNSRGSRSPIFDFGNFGAPPIGLWNFNPGTIDIDLDDILDNPGNDNDDDSGSDDGNDNDFDLGDPGDDFVIVIDPIDPGLIDIGNNNGDDNGTVDVPAPQTALLILVSFAILLYNRKFTP